MQAIDLATIKAAKATDRRALAILAYDNGCSDPAGANWRAIADMLRLALPAGKAKPAAVETDSRFAAWADYDIPATATKKLGKSPILVITFADGEIIRTPAVSLPGKPVNVGRGLRVALAYYQGRMAARAGKSVTDFDFVAGLTIPAVVSCICETSGAEYEPAKCAEHVAAVVAVAPAFDSVPLAAAEYSDADKVAAFNWLQARLHIRRAILEAAGGERAPDQIDRATRMAYAVMTLWPDLAESELFVEPVAPSEIAPPAPVAPSFKPRAEFLASSRLSLVSNPLPVAPSSNRNCVLRVVA